MIDPSTEKWLEFVGGKGPYREALSAAFSAPRPDAPSIAELAQALEALLVVIFCDSEENLGIAADRARRENEYVIAIVPDLDVEAFREALESGARGVVWEDASTAHFFDVARTALQHDVLLPYRVMLDLLSPATSRREHLDHASTEILELVADGLTPREIAAKLSYSERTIRRRITDLCLAFGARNRANLVHLANQR